MVSDVRCSDFGAHNWYVSPSGNNSNDGRTPETARRTLVSAMELARSGDVVHASRGTYDEGFSPTTAGDTTNRVWLTEGVGLVADEGKMVTFIVGRKPSEGGDVGADAIRCVAMASGTWLKGFSLVNGATAQNGSYKDYGGGVYWKTIGVGACVYDCIFDNCSAKRGGAGYGPLFVGCLFRSNCSGDNGTLSLYDCAGAIDCVFESSAYGQFTLVNCSTIDCVVKGNGEQEAYNCYFGMSGNANMTYHGCMVVGAQLEKAEELDEGYAPRFGSPLVDIGDINHYQTNFPSAWIQFSRNDFSGRLRVSNGLMDVGAGEHDYCEQFSDKLKAGHRVFSAEKASSCVRLANDGVVLTDGEALVGTLTMDREGKCEIRTEVTDGTLDIDLDGAPIVGQDGVFAFVCAPGGHRLSFAFAGAGSAKLLKIRGPASGLMLIFR